MNFYFLSFSSPFYLVRAAALRSAVARARGMTVRAFFETFDLPADPIIVLNRFISGRAFSSSVQYLIQTATPFVFDIDDCYWDLPAFSTDGARLNNDLTPLTDARARAAALLTTSTQPLADELSRRFPGKTIVVVPNCLTPAAPVRGGICVANTDAFKADGTLLSSLRQALRSAARAGVPVAFLGENDNFFADESDFVFSEVPRQPYEGYLRHLCAIEPAIGLIPVAASQYSDCKSEIKALEFLQVGAYVYASDISPYRALKERLSVERLELVENTPEAWRAACDRATALLQQGPLPPSHDSRIISLQAAARTAQLDGWRSVGEQMWPLLTTPENRSRIAAFGKRLKLLHRAQRAVGALRSLIGGTGS